jgi:hypothetical protein
MNIKKIIQEEVDDFDWIRDIIPLSFDHINNKGLEFDPPITEWGYWNAVVTSLEGVGCDVDIVLGDDDLNEGILGLYIQNGRTIWTGNGIEEDTYQEHIDEYAGKHVEVIDGRELFPTE